MMTPQAAACRILNYLCVPEWPVTQFVGVTTIIREAQAAAVTEYAQKVHELIAAVEELLEDVEEAKRV
jgi:hypothetical protein